MIIDEITKHIYYIYIGKGTIIVYAIYRSYNIMLGGSLGKVNGRLEE